MQYLRAHADLKRGFNVSLIIVYSEGMSKVNDICASEVAIKTSLQLLFWSLLFVLLIFASLHNFRHLIDGYALCCYDRPAVTVRCFLTTWLSKIHMNNFKYLFSQIKGDRRWLWPTFMADTDIIRGKKRLFATISPWSSVSLVVYSPKFKFFFTNKPRQIFTL